MSDTLMCLSRHDSGQFVESVDDELARIAKDVVRYGGSGSVTIKLTVKANGDRGVSLTPTVAATAPKRVSGQAFYYPDADGHLSRTPPEDEAAQLLRSVGGGKPSLA